MIETKYLFKDTNFLAGADEVGRGPLAGPVVGGCCYLEFKKDADKKKALKHFLSFAKKLSITDSKKISAKKRALILNLLQIPLQKLQPARTLIIKNHELYVVRFCFHVLDAAEIDRINILQAALKAMAQSFLHLFNPKMSQGALLVDGNKKLPLAAALVAQYPLIKGDGKVKLIGLCSVLIKEYRDHLMSDYHQQHPFYHWDKNAGYPTAKHLAAIAAHGVTDFHRKTFRGVSEHV